MTPLELITFFNLHGVSMRVQDLGPMVRQKNRVIIEYKCPNTDTLQTCGGYSVSDALAKAVTRSREELRARILRSKRQNIVDDIERV